MSFKFGKDIFITFEMSGVAYSRPVDKNPHFIAIPSICNQRSLDRRPSQPVALVGIE